MVYCVSLLSTHHANSIINLLRDVQTNLERNTRNYLGECNYTISELMILMLVQKNGTLNISEISAQLGLSKSTISGIVDRLEAEELVKRTKSETDRRMVSVSPTKKHQNIIEQLKVNFENFLAYIFRDASEAEMLEIISGLQRFNRILTANEQG